MSDTAWMAEAGFEQIERRSRWSWGLGALLLLVFAGAFVIIYFLHRPPETPSSLTTIGPLSLSATLLGLVLVFGLYALQKQRTLSRLRGELISRRVQEESLRSRLAELSALFEVAGEVNIQLELDPLLEIIARRVLTCLEADRSSIFLVEEESRELLCRAVSGTDAAAVREARVRVGEGIAGWVAENNEPLVLNDDETVRRFVAEVRPGRGISTALCVPISAGDQVLGVMNLSRIEGVRPFSAADARLMQLFAENVASAIVRMRQFKALREKAGQLAHAKESLERLNRMKQVFLAAVHMELRGPCTVLNAAAEFVQREDATAAERRIALAAILRTQVSRLEGVAERIQDLSRLEHPEIPLRLEMRNPNRLATEISDVLGAAATTRGRSVTTRLEPGLDDAEIDPDLFAQAATALVGGALSVAPRGSEAAVVTRAEDEGWVFEVRCPVEIEPEELERALGFFADGEPADARLEALGLGLHLARRVGELHGGGASASLEGPRELVARLHLPSRSANGPAAEAPEPGRKRQSGAAKARATGGAG
jgi:K+-sensing histidine kinase KdpD